MFFKRPPPPPPPDPIRDLATRNEFALFETSSPYAILSCQAYYYVDHNASITVWCLHHLVIMAFIHQLCIHYSMQYAHVFVMLCNIMVEIVRVKQSWRKWVPHDDVIKWQHFPHNWPFVRGIHRSPWIPLTKASDEELWYFLWSASEQTVEQTLEAPVIWDAITLIMTSLMIYSS